MELPPASKKSIIYARVSSDRQVKEGHGLDSQEQRCRKYAKEKNYEVVRVFREMGVSGGKYDRPAIKEMLAFLAETNGEKYVVIFDDIKRWARDTEIHFALKRAITRLGHVVESTNYRFDNSPEGKFIETMFAATAELERNQNTRQVIQKMKARLELGFWTFRSPPKGLKYIKTQDKGNILTAISPYAHIFGRAIEGYANDRLNTLAEVRSYILSEYQLCGIHDRLSLQGTKNILTELLYTGYIEYPKWNIPRMKGQHMGFISLDTFEQVQDKLNGRNKPRFRNDYSLDFPLRGFVLCDACGKPLTAAWCKGRKDRYPYYWCKTAGCSLKGKMIAKADIEPEFEKLLKTAKPRPLAFKIFGDVFRNVWIEERANHSSIETSNNERVTKLESEVKRLLRSASMTENIDLKKGYETEAAESLAELKKLKKIMSVPRYTEDQLRTAYDKVSCVLERPVETWKSDVLEDRHTVLSMYFEKKLRYEHEVGFRTADLSLPVALMKKAEVGDLSLVEMPGVEPGSEETLLQTL